MDGYPFKSNDFKKKQCARPLTVRKFISPGETVASRGFQGRGIRVIVMEPKIRSHF